ncbi:MAG: 50S ribosomal protein L28 [bacterium]|nr:50S ribosomal protein L28 [bacterium]
MAKVCQICGRGALTGNNRSHSNISTKRKQHINLQKSLHQGKKVKACASCIKSATKKLIK